MASILGPDHCVIGASPDNAAGVREAMLAAGAGKADVLAVSVPSHTPLLDAAVEPFRAALGLVPWADPKSPVLAGISGEKVVAERQMLESLPEQIHRTVRWDLVQQRIRESGCRVVLELGPGSQLAHTMLAGRFAADARSVEEFRSVEGISEWVRRSLQRLE